MDISVHSFIRMARLAEPLMPEGGCLLTVSYYGAEKVVGHYNIMGPVKSALEGTVRYLAAELGPKGIRVNALSPGPLRTRAASGIAHFDELIEAARANAPERRLVTIQDVGGIAMGLVSDLARNVTGSVGIHRRRLSRDVVTTGSSDWRNSRHDLRPLCVANTCPLRKFHLAWIRS